MSEQLDSRIYQALEQPLRTDELCHRLPEIPRKQIAQALARMTEQGLILRNKKNKIGRVQAFGCVCGVISSTKRGYIFLLPDDHTEDVFILRSHDGGAWDGDHVLVHVLDNAQGKKTRNGQIRREGEVIKILARGKKDLTGIVERHKGSLYVIAQRNEYPPIQLVKNHLGGVEAGDMAVVRPVFWGDKNLPPQGVVIEKLGRHGTMDAAIAAALHENGIFDSFPQEALQQADALPQAPEGDASRQDLRDTCLFTIDGDDAKDFDDAVSLEILPNGRFLLGVHIADVSHYVTYASPLDSEAYRRGTSVYYPGHVVPMLPLALSNGICSLNPQVERYAFSALMEVEPDGKRRQCKFVKSIIRSCARLTYRQVNDMLLNPHIPHDNADLKPTLQAMHKLAQALRARRMQRGALDLDIAETQINLGEDGKVSNICPRPRGEAEKLIEEFMLLANEAVAEYLCRREDPAIYRVHDDPDPEKLRAFAMFARQFGYKVNPAKPKDTAQLQAVLNGTQDKPEQRVLPTLLLRSLARARYSEECTGHYGLHARYYLHFTSPIRRYPDLVTHRMLYKAISGQEFTRADWVFCQEAAQQSTMREQAADNAERTIDKLYIADYMAQFIGQDFSGVVSGVTAFGIFVALANGVEGLVRIESLTGDTYEFNPDRMQLTAARSGKRFTIGTKVEVRLLASSNVTGQIDFALTEGETHGDDL